eukprot:272622-Chlamydomonas_euryale.AAC.15
MARISGRRYPDAVLFRTLRGALRAPRKELRTCVRAVSTHLRPLQARGFTSRTGPQPRPTVHCSACAELMPLLSIGNIVTHRHRFDAEEYTEFARGARRWWHRLQQ